MRRILSYIAAAILGVIALGSCQRRPLTEADYEVTLNISIEQDITNYEYPGDPSLMRCIFYDSETGNFVTQAFLPATGGPVRLVSDRTYDILVYNFDTEVTWIDSENSKEDIYASTSLIHDSFKTKIRSRATKDGKEEIVYDPDHLYVGRLEDVFIPARSVEAPDIILDITCSTVVQSWILEVDEIKGHQYIASVAAVITGLADRHYIGLGELSSEYVTVYFDNYLPDWDDKGHLSARFNTFGWHPDCGADQVLTLVFTDVSGKGHLFDIDVSGQFPDNPDQIIRIRTDQIEIPEPPAGSGGGGFAPSVDEWTEIETEIII